MEGTGGGGEGAEIRRTLVGCLGEPAARVARALQRAGVEPVVLFTEDDPDAPWLDDADYACLLPADPGADPFGDPIRLMSCAMDAAADSYHPGPRLLPLDHLQILDNLALAWAGPPPDLLRQAADLLRMRQTARDAGLEPVPHTPALTSTAEARRQVERLGLPLVERRDGRFHRLLATDDDARAAADGATGLHAAGVALSLERAILPAPGAGLPGPGLHARHLLIPVLGDGQGGAVHLPAIEQRRHPDGLIALAACPPPGIDPGPEGPGALAAQLAAAIRWPGVAAVEFFVGPDGRAWFHRLHPGLPESWWLSESVAGADLIGPQLDLLRAGRGGPAQIDWAPGWEQEEIRPSGHALRAQIRATSAGTLERLDLPGETHGADAHRLEVIALRGEGGEIRAGTPLAAITVHSATRRSAMVRAVAALRQIGIEGVESDRDDLVARLTDPAAWSAA